MPGKPDRARRKRLAARVDSDVAEAHRRGRAPAAVIGGSTARRRD
jgi:hypothetical protein